MTRRKGVKTPRKADTYRAARRNDFRKAVGRGWALDWKRARFSDHYPHHIKKGM